MSDYISIDMQAEIMKRLPVKSLIRFRLVSKQWKTIIESSEFISDYNYIQHHQQHNQNHHILIRYFDSASVFYNSKKAKFLSLPDNHNFPLHKYSITFPVSVGSINAPTILTSQGLFCYYNFYPDTINGKKKAVIWNPLINKSIDVEFPTLPEWPRDTVVGFSVCSETGDIKLVKITLNFYDVDLEIELSDPWEVDVFTLSSGVWRKPLCSNLPRHTIEMTENQVSIGRFLYWEAFEMDDKLEETVSLIMSFDTITEEFTEVCLPDTLARPSDSEIVISKLKESLVVIHYPRNAEIKFGEVWMMEHGDTKSFAKLFTINVPDTSIESVLEFRMSGELLIVMKKNDSSDHKDAIFVYDPYSENITSVDICATKFWASSYKETLLLLDQ